jgi:HrpA-like RNA helicase
MDPPPPPVVTSAIAYLADIGACTETRSKRYTKLVPTDYGRLLAALPFAVSDSHIIISGGRTGSLHEALALRAIIGMRPHPIFHHFADTNANEALLRRYHAQVEVKDPLSVAFANLSGVKWVGQVGDCEKMYSLRCEEWDCWLQEDGQTTFGSLLPVLARIFWEMIRKHGIVAGS